MSSADANNNDATYREDFAIGDDHPSLPGHFPGRAIVPGVVLLDRLAAALARWRGLRIAALDVVKFVSPVLPRQAVTLTVREDCARYRFEFISEGRLAASGTIEAVRAT